MAHSAYDAAESAVATSTSTRNDIPHRIRLDADVPSRPNSQAISELCNVMSARLRFVLAQHYQAQIHERVAAQIAASRDNVALGA
jgi:hypothetical protein